MMIRAWLTALAVVLSGLSAFAQGANPATYPDKPVRFIVGFTPGSATDITARLFAQKFAEAWNVPVTVENVPGVGGSVGGDRVAKSAPDGTTFYWGANGALTINPTLLANNTYDVARDLTPVARLLIMPSILAVNNDVPAKTYGELIALAKAQPGKLSMASPGVGTPQHIAGELLKRLAGVDIVHVPYRGAVFTALKRSSVLPDLPTIAESGQPGFEAISWFGLMAPAGTPAAIVDKVYKQAAQIVASAEMKEKLAQLGLDTASDPPQAFGEIIKSDTAKWAKVIKEADIKPAN
jgi:tripartite-type tricarboxylate transporter receptor subunit TctC